MPAGFQYAVGIDICPIPHENEGEIENRSNSQNYLIRIAFEHGKPAVILSREKTTTPMRYSFSSRGWLPDTGWSRIDLLRRPAEGGLTNDQFSRQNNRVTGYF